MKITWSAQARRDLRAIRDFITPFSPPSGPATGFFNGLHPKSKFLASCNIHNFG